MMGQKIKVLQENREKLKVAYEKANSNQPTEGDYNAYKDALNEVINAWNGLESTTDDWFREIIQTLDLRPNSTQASEISIIKSKVHERKYALLLASPEPIDWRRIKIEVSRSSQSIQASLSPSLKLGSNLKISDAQLPSSPTNTDDYWVELLARDEMTLTGYKIEVAEDSPGEIRFEEYFTFPDDVLLNTGRRMRICQKQGPKEVGVQYILGAKIPLTPKITWIRLLDNTGKVVIHDQIIEPKSNYSSPIVLDLSGNSSSSDAILLPNSDTTCALILLKDQAGEVSIPEGDYIIRFEFRRDIGSEAPILRESGDKSSESVTLRFLLT